MVQNLYFEARDQSLLSQAAAAHVMRNRVLSPVNPASVRDVVWQLGQFSWTEDGRSDRMTDLDAISKAVETTLRTSQEKIKDPIGEALHWFVDRKVKPDWAKSRFRFITGRAHLREDGGEIEAWPERDWQRAAGREVLQVRDQRSGLARGRCPRGNRPGRSDQYSKYGVP